MKKMFAAVAVLVLGTTLALAGGGKGAHGSKHGMKHGGWSEKLSEKLNLSDSQKQQIRDLETSFRQQNEPFFNSFRETKSQYREAREAGDTARAESLKTTLDSQKAQMKQLYENQHQRMISILTAEQRAQLEAIKAERGERKRDRE